MTLGSHQRCIGKSQAHFTPCHIIDALGPFDLDPCAGDPRPWDCARINYTENGLALPWLRRDRVWLNPPFHRYEVAAWIQKLADHGDGIALLHARTEAGWFEPIWAKADAILFLADRLKFCDDCGIPQRANSGAPAVLVAFGQRNVDAIAGAGIHGFLTREWARI